MVFWGERATALRFLEEDPEVQRVMSSLVEVHKPSSSQQVLTSKVRRFPRVLGPELWRCRSSQHMQRTESILQEIMKL